MEYLDTYDIEGNFIKAEERSIVHRDALWHKTVHCWLYDCDGNVYFQIRKDKNKLYTTASGHVQTGETLKMAFGREIEEEIGYKVDYEKAELIEINKFVMDREEEDGSVFKDRAFAHVYACLFEGKIEELNYMDEELAGIVKINTKEALEVIREHKRIAEAEKIYKENGAIKEKEITVSLEDFLVNPHETAITKYEKILLFILNKN